MTLLSDRSPHTKLLICRSTILLFVIALSFSTVVSNALGAQVKLAWAPVTGSAVAGYRLHYGPSSGLYTATIDAGQDATCTVLNLISGDTYYFAVTAYSPDNSESGYSNEVSYTVPAEVALSFISIGGPIQVNENSNTQYACTAHYSDGSSAVLTSGVAWSDSSAAATINSGGVLTANSVTADTAVTITAAYSGKSDTHSATIKKIATTLSSLSISGPTQLDEDSGGQYACTAHYSDNSTSIVTDSVQWTVNSEAASINSTGRLTTHAVRNQEHVTVIAAFDGKQANRELIVNNSKTNYSLNVEVIGQGSVQLDPPGGTYDEGTTVTLTAKADQAWAFDGWMGSVADIESSTTSVLMDSDIELSVTFLEDIDQDSVPNQEEWGANSQDMDFDGNLDGIADYLQDNVASLHTKDHVYYITLSVKTGKITQCQPLESGSIAGAPADFTFPLGLFALRIENLSLGATSTLTLHLPAESSLGTLYQYGPTSEIPSAHWYEFMYDQSSETGAAIDGDTVTISLKDGLRGDDDLAQNGIISYTGGPGVLSATIDQPSNTDQAPPGQQLTDGTDPPPTATSGNSSGCFIESIFMPPTL
jgi:Divergent InlB B-repeat domain/Fibronectin type III domain